MRYFHNLLVNVLRTGGGHQQWNDTTIKVLRMKKDRSECNDYLGMLSFADTGKVFLKKVASRLSNYCEAKGILPQDHCGFGPARSTIDMLLVVRPLQELGGTRASPDIMLH